ncbi:MAG: hypothetical protein IT279_08455 [Ignavibacteriaceae bacterium]|nr:hypothetical protein [Ignavibacteriaceae bacterium]
MYSLKFILPLFAILFLFSGCSKDTDIREIHENLREYTNHLVTVTGTVTEVFDLEVITYYILTDNTGKIPVITKSKIPTLGSEQSVSGTVRVIRLVDKTLTALEEK